jgi:hypothetical protein
MVCDYCHLRALRVYDLEFTSSEDQSRMERTVCPSCFEFVKQEAVKFDVVVRVLCVVQDHDWRLEGF